MRSSPRSRSIAASQNASGGRPTSSPSREHALNETAAATASASGARRVGTTRLWPAPGAGPES